MAKKYDSDLYVEEKDGQVCEDDRNVDLVAQTPKKIVELNYRALFFVIIALYQKYLR